jgi:hypothetical protein
VAVAKGIVLSSWNGYERGDEVKVANVRGKFTFYSVRLDDNQEPLWITVIGGTWQHSKYRHFGPTLVSKIKTKKEKA